MSLTPRFIQVRRGPISGAGGDPVLREGEFGYATDVKALKIGDGVTPWSALPVLASEVAADQVQAAIAAAQAASADRVQTGLDRVQTGADRVQTGLDRTATGEDRTAAETARDLSQAWAEGTEPGGAGTKSSREHAEDAAASAALADSEGNATVAQQAAQAAQTAEAGSVAAQGQAEAARDAAFVNADVFPDIATGRAAVADGEQFQVVAGDEIIRYRRDSSTTETEVARYPAASVAGAFPQARRIERRRMGVFAAGEVKGPYLATNDAITATPTWSITSDGELSTLADQSGSVFRYWDAGFFWTGKRSVEVIAEAVFTTLVSGSASGPGVQVGVGGDAASGRAAYNSNGSFGAWTQSGSGDNDRGGAVVSSAMAFAENETVRIRLILHPDGTGILSATSPAGLRQSRELHDFPTSGLIGPAMRRVAAGVFTQFLVRDYDPRLDAVDDLEQQISDLESQLASLESDATQPAAARPLPELIDVAAYNHLLFYGQSNSIGADAVPVISDTQPYSNVTFDGGPRAWDGDYAYAPYKPLVEDLDTTGGVQGHAGVDLAETPCSGAANYASTLLALDGVDPASHVILASTAGRGSFSINSLSKSGTWYNEVLMPMVDAAIAIDADYTCPAVCFVQGERDAGTAETPYADYKSRLLTLQDDLETDIKAKSGQTGPVYLMCVQNMTRATVRDDVARAQFDATFESDKIFAVVPSYRIPYETNIHYSNVGAKLAGAYFGRGYKRMMDGFCPDMLRPVSATLRGLELRVRFDVPRMPLRFDATNLASVTDFGFQVRDDNGAVGIDTIEIAGADVVITLDDEPVGETVVRYALDYAGRAVSGGEEGYGNLRDSAPETITLLGQQHQLFNAALAFQIGVVRVGE